MNNSKKKNSFWTTIPGILTGIAAIISALATLYIATNQFSQNTEVDETIQVADTLIHNGEIENHSSGTVNPPIISDIDSDTEEIESIVENSFSDTEFYNLLNVNSSKCLGVVGGSIEKGAKIVQWRCDGTDNQQWKLVELDERGKSGFPLFNIINKKSGKYLGVLGNSFENGAKAVIWDSDNSENQKWELVLFSEKMGIKYYQIIAKHSRKCLGVVGNSKEDGAKVVQWDDDRRDNQKWRLVPVSN